MIRKNIRAEARAVKDYERLEKTVESEHARTVVRHIKNEEKEHQRELQELSSTS